MSKTPHELEAEKAITASYLISVTKKFANGHFANHISCTYADDKIFINIEAPAFRSNVFLVTKDNIPYAQNSEDRFEKISITDDLDITNALCLFSVKALSSTTDMLVKNGQTVWDSWKSQYKK